MFAVPPVRHETQYAIVLWLRWNTKKCASHLHGGDDGNDHKKEGAVYQMFRQHLSTQKVSYIRSWRLRQAKGCRYKCEFHALCFTTTLTHHYFTGQNPKSKTTWLLFFSRHDHETVLFSPLLPAHMDVPKSFRASLHEHHASVPTVMLEYLLWE